MTELLPKRFVSGKALSLPAAMILREYPDALNVPGRDDVNRKLVLRTTRIKEIKVFVVSHKKAVTPLFPFLCHCRGAVPDPRFYPYPCPWIRGEAVYLFFLVSGLSRLPPKGIEDQEEGPAASGSCRVQSTRGGSWTISPYKCQDGQAKTVGYISGPLR